MADFLDYDPTTFYERQLRQFMGGSRPAPRFPVLSPEEEESTLGALGRRVMSGISAVGTVLDTPGSFVRGLLAGEPGRAFGGILDSGQRVSGRDLLERTGLLSANTEGLDWGDVAGFGVDLATDPLTYIGGFGALSKAGGLAKAAGVLPRGLRGRLGASLGSLVRAGTPEMDALQNAARAAGTPLTPELLNAPLAGLARVRVPFTEGALLGEGRAGIDALDALGRAAGKVPGLSRAGGALAPVGRGLNALFRRDAGGAVTETLQEANFGRNAGLPRRLAEEARLPVYAALMEAAGPGKVLPPDAEEVIQGAFEGLASPLPNTPVARAVAQLRPWHDAMPAAQRELGIDARELPFHAPRQMADHGLRPSFAPRVKGSLDPANRFHAGREEIFGDLPAWHVNALARHDYPGLTTPWGQLPQLRQEELLRQTHLFPWEEVKPGVGRPSPVTVAAPDMDARWLDLNQKGFGPAGRNTLRLTDADLAEIARLQSVGPLPVADQIRLGSLRLQQGAMSEFDRLQAIREQSEGLAGWARGLPPEYAAQKLPFFEEKNVFGRLVQLGEADVKSRTKAEAVYDAFAKSVRNPGAGPTVPLVDALAGLHHKGNFTLDGTQDAMRRVLGLPPGASLRGLNVAKDVADDILRTIQPGQAPEGLRPLLNLYDSFTSLLKFGQIGPWPARYTRDLLQQGLNMAVHGHADPRYARLDPRAYLTPMREARGVLERGEVLPGAASLPQFAGSGRTDAQATAEIVKQMYARGVAGHASRLGRGAAELGEAAAGPHVPGAPRPGLLPTLNKMYNPGQWSDRNPFHLAGVNERKATTFTPAAAAHELSQKIDDATRGGSYLALLRQGYGFDAAADEVLRGHLDFSNLSGFERSVMRRAFPYYSWSRQSLPNIAEQLTTLPGGPTATAVKTLARAKEEEGFRPEYISETLGIPLGPSEVAGRSRYLTSLGLPFEDLRDLSAGRGVTGNVARTLENLLGQAHPAVKMPLELATGRQFYSGRNLADLHGPTGEVGLDQLIMNSPASRAYTTYRTLTDPSKGAGAKLANVLGPGRVTDTDMEKARDRAAQEVITELLRGTPGVRVLERPYVPAGLENQLSPEEVALMRLQATLEKRAQERAKARK